MAQTSATPRSEAPEPERLDVSPYDRASSLMIAALVTIGLLTVLLVAGWLSLKVYKTIDPGVPVKISGVGDGNGDPGGSMKVDVLPGDQSSGTDEKTAGPSHDPKAINDDVAQAIQIDEAEDGQRTSKGSTGDNDGIGGGPGKGSPYGVRDPGKHETQRNWEVRFEKGLTLDAYARLLDFFHIELGVVRAGTKVQYAANLAKAKPDTREIAMADVDKRERRYWLRWTSGELRLADDDLLRKAGIDAGDDDILKFLPPEVESQLARLEQDMAGPERAKIVKRTCFGVRKAGKGYEFFVLEQKYK